MIVTYRWLKDYVDFDLPVEELAARLTMVGFEVEDVTRIGGDYEGVVTARIETVQKHPDAEHLTICTVFDGQETFPVVCGAPNSEAGRIGVLARVGARLPGGKIKKGKIRGVESLGMLCARDELGMGDDHSGIWLLPDDTPLGQEPLAALGLDDWKLDLGVTPNRPDCLSVIGVAREVAALTGGTLKMPELALEPVGGEIDDYMTIDIQAPDKCPRYCGILVKGVKIAPSPPWMVHRLEASGVRSINNVVDITNFVLLEYGQPLHGFDYRFLASRKIVVRRAHNGETMITLDEQSRILLEDDLLICDGDTPVALAGIMGGLNSLVSADTVDVFIESAYFEPTGIRRTSKRLGLASESSHRFERGTGIDNTVLGAHRAARLMEELADGAVVPGFSDAYPKNAEPVLVTMRPDRVNRLLGASLSVDEMAGHLASIELKVLEASPEKIQVQVPSFRVDLTREVDLAEEIARLHGFGNIEPTIHQGTDGENRPWRLREFLRELRTQLAGMGLSELNTFSFVEEKALAAVGAPAGIRLANPLSEDFAIMRTSLLPGLLKASAVNQGRQVDDIRVFEARRVYLPVGDATQPDEPHRLGLLMCGPRRERFWQPDPAATDFFDIKGVVERLLTSLGIADLRWRSPENPGPYLPGVCAEIWAGEAVLGRLGKLRADVLEHFEVSGEVVTAELDIEALAGLCDMVPIYRPVSKYPPIFRDLALVADADAPVDEMLAAIAAVNEKRITRLRVFDVYMGKGVPEGKKSVAFSMWFQDVEKSLSDKDADKLTRQILAALEKGFGASLRE